MQGRPIGLTSGVLIRFRITIIIKKESWVDKIDFCSDVGGSFGKHIIGEDEEVIKYITSANIDCGWHGGDPIVMNRTVQLAKNHHVNVGAHPGLPDLLGFGQRNMSCTPFEIYNYVLYQLGAFNAFCLVNDIRPSHIKLAANLYHMARENEDIAEACVDAVLQFDSQLIFVIFAGERGNTMKDIAEKAGLGVVREFFPGRAYSQDGMLVSRQMEGSLITDPSEATDRVLRAIKDNKVKAIDGTDIFIEAQTICVHSWQKGAGKMAAMIRTELERHEVVCTSMTNLV